MIAIGEGRLISEIKVVPKNWKSKASIERPWFIYYRYYDDIYKGTKKYGHLVRIKSMNKYSEHSVRKAVTEQLIAHELDLLRNHGYNPVSNTAKQSQENEYLIDPQEVFYTALRRAGNMLKITPESKREFDQTLKNIKPAIEMMGFGFTPIKDIGRRHIKAIFEYLHTHKKTFTASTHNRYRKNLHRLFEELIQMETIDANPVTKLARMKTTVKLRELLTAKDIELINTKLKKEQYRFWRFIHIFCNSGARTTELLAVRRADVDLSRQVVRYTIKKGSVIRQVERPIKDSILHLWIEICENAKHEQYLFSVGLQPGDKMIASNQPQIRWRKYVQIGLGIKKTWYSLKHLNTDTLTASHGSKVASSLNKHDEAMTLKHYAVNEQSRIDEAIKKSGNPLG